MANGVSKKAVMGGNSKIEKANLVAYPVKKESEDKKSKGAFPSNINK